VTFSYLAPRSQWIDLSGPVHYVDYGGPADGPLLVCVHGLGGSLVNWSALAPRLTGSARVLAVDLAGFGHTRTLGRSTSVPANQRLLHRFLVSVLDGPAILVGNSMGGLIASLQAHAHPETVAAAVLIDPALPLARGARPDPLVATMFAMYALPRVGRATLTRRRRRSSPEEAAIAVLRLCGVDTATLPPEVLEQHFAVARTRRGYDEADDALLGAAKSLLAVLARRRRHAAMLAGMAGPVLLLHGERDRLVPIASARAAAKANPQWRFEVAADAGHVPQLQVPDWTAQHILDWLATEAYAAGTSTRDTHLVVGAAAADPDGSIR
jgi:pimeloyl-ACP methyl ester carboxylesterase